MTQTQGTAELDALVHENKQLFIYFWAPWCAPCKQFSMVYELVADQFSDIQFLKMNIEKHKELVDFLSIRSIPHLMAIKEGIVIYSDAGSISEASLIELAIQMQAVDVSALKA